MNAKDSPVTVPNVYVIAGPNGAGKTTFATEFLPDFVKCRQFLNADLIAAGLSPFAPETQNLRAARLQLSRIRELVTASEDFGFETTLAGRAYVQRLQKMKASGYRVNLFFLWLPTADLAIERVATRVRQGGHEVPEPDIRRRYAAGLRNFFELYAPVVDSWWFYDASCLPPELITSSDKARIEVRNDGRFEQIKRQTNTNR